eukprot:COSAG06_NODE_455_length_15521_cov_8.312022_2_plen_87_part_00
MDADHAVDQQVGFGPVLNGGLHLSDMHITQAVGSRNYSLHWRDGHVAGGHPTAYGWMIGNHSMMPANGTPNFNWCVLSAASPRMFS